MNHAEGVLQHLRAQGTTVRAERTSRVYDGVVQPWTAIIFAGRMPGPTEMSRVKQYREPILEILEREGLINYPNEPALTWDFDYSFPLELPDCPEASARWLRRKAVGRHFAGRMEV